MCYGGDICYYGRALFHNLTLGLFLNDPSKIYGISIKNGTYYLMAGSFFNDGIDELRLFDSLRRIIFNQSILDPQVEIVMEFSHYSPKNSVFSLLFEIHNSSKPIFGFDLPYQLNGTLYTNGKRKYISAKGFDVQRFHFEGSLFSSIFALYILLNFIGWRSLDKYLQEHQSVSGISILSLIISMVFDLVFGLFIPSIVDLDSSLFGPLWLLFFIEIASFFFHQITIFSRIIHYHVSEVSFRLFVSGLLVFAGSMIILQIWLVSVPFISVMYAMSMWIPQILNNIQIGIVESMDKVFIILVSFSRLIVLMYFCLYKNNIIEYNAPFLAISCTIWVLLQLLVLYLQIYHRFSPVLANFFRPKYFSFLDTKTELISTCVICYGEMDDEEPSITTPCGHTFHEQCLFKWQKENMLCPMCRSPIPKLYTMKLFEEKVPKNGCFC